jgi:hypothetical protein
VPFVCCETIISERYVRLIPFFFFDHLTEDEKSYRNFVQDNATAHTSNNSMNVCFWSASDESRIVACRSTDLNPCNFYIWGTLRDTVYVNNSHSLRKLKEDSRQENSVIPRQELRRVSTNFFQDVRPV